jgi:hypothetical protein
VEALWSARWAHPLAMGRRARSPPSYRKNRGTDQRITAHRVRPATISRSRRPRPPAPASAPAPRPDGRAPVARSD